jgi:[acyl-carrier-protein] S-malonyltransferase
MARGAGSETLFERQHSLEAGTPLQIAVIFPGQGAQAPGLGSPWIDSPSWAIVERAEKATGEALAPLLIDASAEQLGSTREAQLVVFLASLLAWDAAEGSVRGAGEVVAFGGHSLGQVTALIAAGALAFDDGCRLAARRARHTQDAANARPGRLAALLGATTEQAERACAAAPGACWIANDNAPGQVVIGGTAQGLDDASARAKELGVKKVIPLNVGGAFHTPLMQAAADAFATDLSAAPFVDTELPVLSNTDGRPYTDAAGWPARLADQLINPVRWAATMPALVALGADTFVEVGPGTTLTSMAKRAMPDVALRNLAVPSDLPLEPAHA